MKFIEPNLNNQINQNKLYQIKSTMLSKKYVKTQSTKPDLQKQFYWVKPIKQKEAEGMFELAWESSERLKKVAV